MDIYLCAKNEKENAALRKFCVSYFIRHNVEADILSITSADELQRFLSDEALVNLYMVDTQGPVVSAASYIQAGNRNNYIILIGADLQQLLSSISPGIRPSGVIVKPIRSSELTGMMDRIWEDYMAFSDDKGQFIFSVQGEKYIVPYSRILFFESAEKKVIIRTDNQEFDFYGSMLEIAKQTPETFLRVHRSYIVNMEHVERVDFTDNMIYMDDESMVSVSRNNRKMLAAYLERENDKIFSD